MSKKPALIIILLLFITTITSYTYAQTPELPNITANWNSDLQQISVTWDKPLTKIDSDQDGFNLYRQENGKWRHFKSVPVGSTGIGIKDVDPNTEYILRLCTSRIGKEFHSNEVTVTTAQELKFACWANCVNGKDIRIGWHNAKGHVGVEYIRDGKTVYSNYNNTTTGDNESYQSKNNNLPGINYSDNPKKGETWEIVFSHNGETFSHTVFCGTEKEKKEREQKEKEDGIPGGLDESGNSDNLQQIKGPIPIFTQETWPVVMFWYVILASLSSVFIFLVIVRNGYQYMFSATSNPGLKASFSETIEKCIIALIVIMAAPLIVGLLIQINDGLVSVFANVLNSVKLTDIGLDNVEFEVNFINKMIAWPIKLIFVDLPNKLFDLHPLSHLIFNNETDIIDPCIFMGYLNTGEPINLGDPLASVIVTMIFAVFNIIFNAIYTIRGWVVTAVLCATPLVVWIWVLSAQKTVIEIWLSELFQTIFMQTWHALTFAIIFSILLFRGRVPEVPSITDNLAELLLMAGKFFAAFGGIICVGVIIYHSYRLIVGLTATEGSKHIAEYKTNLQKALIGLVILGLALLITQTIFPHEVPILQPTVTGGSIPRVTIWQLFFAFFVTLPISKMMSNMFMSLLARFGTVDEQALGTRSLGMLGGLVTLGAVSATGARSAYLSNERQAERIANARSSLGGSSGSSPGGASPNGGGSGGSSGGGSGFSSPGGGGSSFNRSGSSSGSNSSFNSPAGDNKSNVFTSPNYEEPGICPTNYEEPGIYPKGELPNSPSYIDEENFSSPKMFTNGSDNSGDINSPINTQHYKEPGIYLENEMLDNNIGGIGTQYEEPGIYPSPHSTSSNTLGAKSDTGEKSPKDAQKDSFRETLKDASIIGSGSIVAAGAESAVRSSGYLAGSVVGQGQAAAAVFGTFGKHIGNTARTFSTGYQVYKSVKGEDRTQTFANLQKLTDRTTSRGAIAQTAVGIALTPLGSHRAASASKKIGGWLDAK